MFRATRLLFSINILKTIFFNLYYFGLKGLKLPILIGWNFHIENMGDRTAVTIPQKYYHTGTVCLGLKKGAFSMGRNGTIA